jgi:hypothetical protein
MPIMQEDMFPEDRDALLEKLYSMVKARSDTIEERRELVKGYNEQIRDFDNKIDNLLDHLGMTKADLRAGKKSTGE